MSFPSPTLHLLAEVRRSIEKGQSIRQGLVSYLSKADKKHSDFVKAFSQWLGQLDQGQIPEIYQNEALSLHKRYLLKTLERGLKGEPVLSHLASLEEEVLSALTAEQGRHLARLPYILMIPLLIFMFPAFLILLFGPLLSQFVEQMGR